jgi:RNA polymerase sigma-70 factor (ECF subfamily)
MNKPEELATLFDDQRGHLRAVAYRMLGSVSEADDAVQEAWLRLNRSDATAINNLEGWLTTVVARVCLDVLRSRKSRREEALDEQVVEPAASKDDSSNPEQEALLADSVGLALLVVLDTLTPAERVAFVLHDVLDLSFEEIAPIVGRTTDAARQLASRARRRVRGGEITPAVNLQSQRTVVDAFLTALRGGDFEGLLAVLDPDVIVRSDGVGAPGSRTEIRGAKNWAKGAVAFGRLAQSVQPALINGAVGLVFAPGGRLTRALSFVIAGGRIVEVEVIGDQERLKQLELGVFE